MAAAVCIAPSISSPIPGRSHGKPAGVACVQLDAQRRGKLFGKPERPAFCASLRPTPDVCGGRRGEAVALRAALDRTTAS